MTNFPTTSRALLASFLLLLPLLAAHGQEPAAEKPPPWLPEEPIVISEETTRLTEPLDDDGYVDYVAALNQQYSQGVTPENNAMVGLIHAFGPGVLGEVPQEEFFAELGIKPPPAEGEYFVSYEDFLDGLDLSPPARAKAYAEFDEMWENVGRCRTEDYPNVAQWLAANEAPLATIVAASELSHYYCPLVIDVPEEDRHLRLVFLLLPTANLARDTARALAARARLQAGEGEIEAALADLIAGRRLARLTGSGPHLVHALIGYAMEAIILRAEQNVLNCVSLSPEQATLLRDQWKTMPPIASCTMCLDRAERYVALDCLINFMLKGPEAFSDQPAENMNEFFRETDWNAALRRVNETYDDLLETAAETDLERRTAAIDAIFERIEAPAEAMDNPLQFFGDRWEQSTAETRAELISSYVLLMMVPAVNAMLEAEADAQASENLAIVAGALTEYQATEGEYPATLETLVPAYLAELPPDPFSGKPLEYRGGENGFTLYSIGRNRTNDNGVPGEATIEGDRVFAIGGGGG